MMLIFLSVSARYIYFDILFLFSLVHSFRLPCFNLLMIDASMPISPANHF